MLIWLGATIDAISHRLVYRIDRLGILDRARGPKPAAILQKPSEQTSRAGDRGDYCGHVSCAASAVCPLLGFGPMPARFYLVIFLTVIVYMAVAEITKRVFYRTYALPREGLAHKI